jgi:acyl-CoA dehydrogenase
VRLKETPGEQAFRAELRAWLDATLPGLPDPPPFEDWAAKRAYDTGWQRTLYDAGYAGISWPKEYGGRGATPSEELIFLEETERAGAPYVGCNFVSTLHAGPTIAAEGTPEQRARYLPPILRGDNVWCQGFSEPEAGSDLASLRTRAVRDGDHYVINGSKMFITNGATADVFFLAARVEAGDAGPRHRGISMFLVERDTPGFTVSRTLDKMGMRASDTAELSFIDMRVPAANLLGREGVGFYEVMRVFQRERLVAGLHAVAMAERALEDTIAYVRERQAFGGPLSDKQVVRHKLADLATQIEAGRWLTYAACAKFAAGDECVREISMVKLFTAEMVNRVAYDCVQLHGGYGYMREYAVERFARDARLMTIGGGTSEIMREIIAKAVLP